MRGGSRDQRGREGAGGREGKYTRTCVIFYFCSNQTVLQQSSCSARRTQPFSCVQSSFVLLSGCVLTLISLCGENRLSLYCFGLKGEGGGRKRQFNPFAASVLEPASNINPLRQQRQQSIHRINLISISHQRRCLSPPSLSLSPQDGGSK